MCDQTPHGTSEALMLALCLVFHVDGYTGGQTSQNSCVRRLGVLRLRTKDKHCRKRPYLLKKMQTSHEWTLGPLVVRVHHVRAMLYLFKRTERPVAGHRHDCPSESQKLMLQYERGAQRV
jgi:hypothetical protein